MCLTIGCDTHAPYDAMRSDCEAICARFIPLRSFLDEMTMRMRVFGVFFGFGFEEKREVGFNSGVEWEE